MRKKIINTVLYILAFLWCTITILPLLITVLSSFKNNDEIYLGMFEFPKLWRFSNYAAAAETADALIAIGNSLLMAFSTTITVTVIGMMAAYVLSRKNRIRFVKPLNVFFLVGVMVPVHCTIVPISNIASAFHAKDQYWFLLLIYTTFNLAQAIFLYSGFLNGIDRGLDEAAIIDGATRWNVFTKITVPLSKPIIVYTILTSFMGPWVDFIFGKVICRADAQYYTVSIGLWKMLEKEYIDSWYTCFAAGAVVVSIPIAILFLMTQKFYVEGMTGAVKG